MIHNQSNKTVFTSAALFVASLVALGVLGKHALCINGPTFQTKNMYSLLMVDDLFIRLCRPSP